MHFSLAQCAIMHPAATGTALMAWNNLLIIDLEGRAKQCVIEMQEYVTGKGPLEARSRAIWPPSALEWRSYGLGLGNCKQNKQQNIGQTPAEFEMSLEAEKIIP